MTNLEALMLNRKRGDGMLTINELKKYLKKNDCDFEIINHEYPIYSVEDAAGYFDIKKAVPTLIVETEDGLVALIVSSQRGRLSFEELKNECGFLKMKLADKQVVREKIGCLVGTVPLIGSDLPCVFDERLLAYDYIYGGTGDSCRTLKIRPADVLRLNQVLWFIE